MGAPLPLTNADILDFENVYGLPCEIDIFSRCIDALDSDFLSEELKKIKKSSR